MKSDRMPRGQKREGRKKADRLEPGFELPDESHVRKEKEKARLLRQSAWWTRKIREGICYYCRREVGSLHLTMDHVIPLSRGGKSRKGNLVPACKDCNNRKKYLIPVEWQEYLRRLAEETEKV